MKSIKIAFQKKASRSFIRIAFFYSMVVGTSSWATESMGRLNLEQALTILESHSPKIQKIQSFIEETRWKKTEAFSTYYPTLTANASYLFDKRYLLTDVQLGAATTSIPAIIPTTNYSLTAQYLLFDGFSSTARYNGASAMEKSALAEGNWTRFQLKQEVSLLFYKALASQILKDVASANLATLEDHLKDTNLFKKEGLSTKYDVLRVEVQVSEAKSELLNASDNIETSKGKLVETLGLDDFDGTLAGSLPTPTSLQQALSTTLIAKSIDSSNAYDSQLFQYRQDLTSLNYKIDSLQQMQNATGRHWVPKLSLFGTWQSYNNRNDKWDDFNSFREAYQVGVNLSWSFFDGFASTAKDHQSIEQKFQAESQLRALQLKTKQDFNLWKRKFNYFATIYQSRQNDIQKSMESVRLAKEGIRVGSRTNTDLLDAEAELYRAQAGAVNAQIGAIEAFYNLELTLGKSL
jgi:outer membrane protein TolC